MLIPTGHNNFSAVTIFLLYTSHNDFTDSTCHRTSPWVGFQFHCTEKLSHVSLVSIFTFLQYLHDRNFLYFIILINTQQKYYPHTKKASVHLIFDLSVTIWHIHDNQLHMELHSHVGNPYITIRESSTFYLLYIILLRYSTYMTQIYYFLPTQQPWDYNLMALYSWPADVVRRASTTICLASANSPSFWLLADAMQVASKASCIPYAPIALAETYAAPL